MNWIDPIGLSSGYLGLVSQALKGGGGIALTYGLYNGNYYVIGGGIVAIGIGGAIDLYQWYSIPDDVKNMTDKLLEPIRKEIEENEKVKNRMQGQCPIE